MTEDQIAGTVFMCIGQLCLGGIILMIVNVDPENAFAAKKRFSFPWFIRLAGITLVSLPVLIIITAGVKTIINTILG